MLEGSQGGHQGGQETGFDTRLLGWEQQVLCSTESPLHVGDSMDKNLHSTGKQEGLRGVKTKMGITAQPTMLNIYDPGQLPLWYSLALHGAGEVKFATSGWKITDDLTDLRSLV